MRQRKEMMEHLSHGFVMAPGGIGTLEEDIPLFYEDKKKMQKKG